MPKGANVKGKGAGKSFSSVAKGAPIWYNFRDNGRCDRVDCHMGRPIEPSGASCLRRVVVSVVSVASLCPLCLSLLSCLLCPSRRLFVGSADLR